MSLAPKDLGPPPAGNVPLSVPRFLGNEVKYLHECMESGWISSAGPFVSRFERGIADALGVKHAIATVNGTSALHLALRIAGVRSGDEVLVPSLTFIATINAACYAGALPRFVDAEDATFGMDPDKLEAWLAAETLVRDGACYHRASGRRIAACVPVHVFGHPARIDQLATVCASRAIPLIEDAAESLGSTYRGRHTGTFGQAGCLSFNGNKIITTGGGGMIVTDDDEFAARARHLSTQAKSDGFAYWHDEVGYNYRMPSLNAAVGCGQLERLPEEIRLRRQLAHWYREELSSAPEIRLAWEPDGANSNFWLQTLRVPDRARRDAILSALNAAGYQARPIWGPGHRQPIFSTPLTCGSMDATDRLWQTTVNVPSSSGLRKEQVAAIVEIARTA